MEDRNSNECNPHLLHHLWSKMHDKNKTKYITNTPVKEKACRRMSRKDYQQNDKNI